MLRATIKDLRARKLRLITTSLAVLLGVAFMAGTLVFTSTLDRTFDDLFTDVYEGTDAVVRSPSRVATPAGEQRARLDDGLVAQVAAVDGVAAAEGAVFGFSQIVGADGEPIGNPGQGAPTFGGNWSDTTDFNPYKLVEGRPPEADDEVVIDRFAADEGDLGVGDRAAVLTPSGNVEVTVVGVSTFGEVDSAAGSTFVGFTLPAAQRLIAEPGKVDSVQVQAAEGVSQTEVRDRVAEALPSTEVLTGEEITAEQQDAIAQGLSFFNTFLLAFAVIALFVGAFIIYNTFSIIVAQRTRELALFRALGASRTQVLVSVLVEAAVVGLVAGGLGLVAGIGVAAGLKALLAGFGLDLPSGGVVVTGGTIVAALLAGVGISLVSAVFPARKASSVAPIAAMRDVAVDTAGRSRWRVAAGAAVTGLGMASLVNGLYLEGGNGFAEVGLGAALVFLGVAVLGPVIARPVSRLLGAPLRSARGVTGALAQENAARNPKRTSASAAALMIGVGLVVFITVFAQSTTASIDKAIDQTFRGDFVLDSGTFGFGGIDPEAVDRLNARPEVAAASGVALGGAERDGTDEVLLAVEPDRIGDIFDIGLQGGTASDLAGDGVAVLDTYAEDNGWSVGDEITLTFAETGRQPFRVVATFTEGQVTAPARLVLSQQALAANVPGTLASQVFVTAAEGVEAGAARAAVEEVAADYPNVTVRDQTEYKEATTAQVDQLLGLIYALLGLAVIIALMGIGNTLALSIFERTHELGLLRAVGATRAQVRSMVRWESVLIALLGTVLGMVIGLAFGWALVEALSDEGIDVFRVPVPSLVAIVLIALVAGVVAAVLPARRAARLNVLQAIAFE